ncbi:DUF4389 domain-containing protein [Nitrosococcus wardiae]|uniref:DUF4389 domain-containing protein n=1 Tax=Nitrosococcus wardiae TaxID=1814290 RepID=A0A4P7BYG2_9GAMM|nr:DUF4389 domain-containing protein [Nitrosococcus wardiae]QBQ53456.1 DUF4389 domain-containing protein [Nitrosococcus wardiae]
MTNQEATNVAQNLKNPTFWKRLLFMMLFAVAYTLAEFAVWAAIIFLIFYNLFTGGSNERAVTFGRQASAYIYHLLLYLTYNTEERPFPFSDWPKPESMPTGLGRPLTSKPGEPATGNAPSSSADPATGTVQSAPEAAKINPTSSSEESSQAE